MFAGNAASPGALPHLASPGFPQGSGAHSASKRNIGVNGLSFNKAKPPAHGVVAATEANQRLWDVTTEYERLLRLQGELQVLSKQHRAAELAHLQHIQSTLTGTLGDRDAAAARIRAKTEEASAAQAVRLVELDFFAALGGARQRQVSDLRRMCESDYARLEHVASLEGRGSAERLRGRAACLESRVIARQADVQQLAATSEAASRRIEDLQEAVAAAERERDSLAPAQPSQPAQQAVAAWSPAPPALAADVGAQVAEMQLQLAGAGRTLEQMANSSAWAHNTLPFEFSDYVDSKDNPAVEDGDVSALELAPSTRSETIQACHVESLPAVIDDEAGSNELGKSVSSIKSNPCMTAGGALVGLPEQKISPAGTPHSFLWRTPQNSHGGTPRMLSNTTKELSTSRQSSLQDSESFSKLGSPACNDALHDSQAFVSPPPSTGPAEEWQKSFLGGASEPVGDVSQQHQFSSSASLQSEDEHIAKEVADQNVHRDSPNVATNHSASLHIESPWQSGSFGNNERYAMEPSPPVQQRVLNEWSVSEPTIEVNPFARQRARQLNHATDPFAAQHRQAEELIEPAHVARQIQAEPLIEPSHVDAFRASVTWPSPIGSPVRPIGASVVDDGVAFVKDEEAPPHLPVAGGDSGAGSPVAVPRSIVVVNNEQTVDAALQDFLAQPRNRLRRALFHRLGAGEYLYGARRARLRLEPSTGELEAADRGSAWEPIEEFARRAEKSQSARLRKARERGTPGAM